MKIQLSKISPWQVINSFLRSSSGPRKITTYLIRAVSNNEVINAQCEAGLYSIMVLAQRKVLRAASRNCDSPKIKPSLLSADDAIAFPERWSHPLLALD